MKKRNLKGIAAGALALSMMMSTPIMTFAQENGLYDNSYNSLNASWSP